MRFLLLSAALAYAGCTAAATPEPAGTATQTPMTLQEAWQVGTVRVVGSAPVDVRTVLQTPAGRSIEIRGPLAQEIGRLSGAEVAVYGALNGETVQARAYDVRSVDGAPAVTGVVEQGPAGELQLRTDRGEVVRLTSVPPGLRVGQRVWVQGSSTVQVQSYGVIRP